MEKAEISIHLARVYQTLARSPDDWMSARDVCSASGVAIRTSRAHCLALVRAGIVDQMDVFPAHLYRISSLGDKRNKTFLQRLQMACEAFRI